MLRGLFLGLAERSLGTPPASSRFGDSWPKAACLLWRARTSKAAALKQTDSPNRWLDFRGMGQNMSYKLQVSYGFNRWSRGSCILKSCQKLLVSPKSRNAPLLLTKLRPTRIRSDSHPNLNGKYYNQGQHGIASKSIALGAMAHWHRPLDYRPQSAPGRGSLHNQC